MAVSSHSSGRSKATTETDLAMARDGSRRQSCLTLQKSALKGFGKSKLWWNYDEIWWNYDENYDENYGFAFKSPWNICFLGIWVTRKNHGLFGSNIAFLWSFRTKKRDLAIYPELANLTASPSQQATHMLVQKKQGQKLFVVTCKEKSIWMELIFFRAAL